MPFKIIETSENGKHLLSTVPADWEHEGTLFWPRKNESILIKSEFSVPEKNWKKIPCILKRNNIPNYEASENEIRLMSDMSDTDLEVNEERSSCRNRRPEESILVIPINFNDLATKCVSENINNAEVTVQEQQISVMDVLDDSVFVPEPNNEVPGVVDIPEINNEVPGAVDIPEISVEKKETTSEKLDQLVSLAVANQTNIQILFDNQQSILQKLALLDTKLEEYITRTTVAEAFPNQKVHNNNSIIISNLEELTRFEEQLSNVHVEENLKKMLSVTCAKGKGRGCTNAYALIDAMFSRQFLTQCSWAGGTRGDPKICFKSFTKTISLFFQILHESDNSFTKPECEAFLKNVIRHSVKRNAAKMLRTSAQKRRPKKTNALQEVNNQQCVRNASNTENVRQQNLPSQGNIQRRQQNIQANFLQEQENIPQEQENVLPVPLDLSN